MNTETNNEFVLSIVVRKRDDCEQPNDPAEAVRLVRGLLEQGTVLDVLNVVGRRRYTALPEPTVETEPWWETYPPEAEEQPLRPFIPHTQPVRGQA